MAERHEVGLGVAAILRTADVDTLTAYAAAGIGLAGTLLGHAKALHRAEPLKDA